MQDLVVKGEDGFLGVLKEVSGTTKFDQKLEEMQHALVEATQKK